MPTMNDRDGYRVAVNGGGTLCDAIFETRTAAYFYAWSLVEREDVQTVRIENLRSGESFTFDYRKR